MAQRAAGQRRDGHSEMVLLMVADRAICSRSTEAHTIEASPEAASTGMYYRDWSAQFDYFHHEESQ